MEKLFLIAIFSLIVIISCKKQESQQSILICNDNFNNCQYRSYILAGQTDGIGINYSNLIPFDSICFPYNHQCSVDTTIIDIDNDGLSDFIIINWDLTTCLSFPSQGIDIISSDTNAFVCVLDNDKYIVRQLTIDDSISNQLAWSNNRSRLYSFTYHLEHYNYTYEGLCWITNQGYLGIKIKRYDHEYFGWIDIYGFLIKKYAITIPIKK